MFMDDKTYIKNKQSYIACLSQVLMACILPLAANDGVSLFTEACAFTALEAKGGMGWSIYI